jgi:hypothetical protein
VFSRSIRVGVKYPVGVRDDEQDIFNQLISGRGAYQPSHSPYDQPSPQLCQVLVAATRCRMLMSIENFALASAPLGSSYLPPQWPPCAAQVLASTSRPHQASLTPSESLDAAVDKRPLAPLWRTPLRRTPKRTRANTGTGLASFIPT